MSDCEKLLVSITTFNFRRSESEFDVLIDDCPKNSMTIYLRDVYLVGHG